jgi:hypothetical protein
LIFPLLFSAKFLLIFPLLFSAKFPLIFPLLFSAKFPLIFPLLFSAKFLSCTCEDFRNNEEKLPCKHIWEVEQSSSAIDINLFPRDSFNDVDLSIFNIANSPAGQPKKKVLKPVVLQDVVNEIANREQASDPPGIIT